MAWNEVDEFAPPQIQAVYRLVKEVKPKSKILYIGSKAPKNKDLLSPLMADTRITHSELVPETHKPYDLVVLDGCDLTVSVAGKTLNRIKFKNQKVLAIGYTDEQIQEMKLSAANCVVDGRNVDAMNNLPATIEEMVLPPKSIA